MSASETKTEEALEIDLCQPGWAAFWAWLWPGAGHLYQGRRAKGLLLMVCILAPYFWGLVMGGGHVVYASWTPTDKRWQYICQFGVGLPALPALIQNRRVMAGQEPLLMDVMAPPRQPVVPDREDQLAEWHKEYHWYYELGVLFTMVAGLLNVLAIYDAYAGPFLASREEEAEKEK